MNNHLEFAMLKVDRGEEVNEVNACQIQVLPLGMWGNWSAGRLRVEGVTKGSWCVSVNVCTCVVGGGYVGRKGLLSASWTS